MRLTMSSLFFTLLFGNVYIFVISRRNNMNMKVIPGSDQYLMKPFLPYLVPMVEKLRYGYKSRYDRSLLILLSELYGQKNALQQLKLHYSNKLALMLVALMVSAFIGTASDPDMSYLLFCISVQGAVFYFTDNDIKEKIKKRRIGIKIDFPDFIIKLTLLVNAGMNISRALEKIVRESNSSSPLYIELNSVLTDIAAGKSEAKALEEFSRRCRTPEIMKFVSIVLQNLRKGSSEMVPILRILSAEAWEMRKSTARKMGEEASTKLLFPMMIMFIAILLIVVTPAILSLQAI